MKTFRLIRSPGASASHNMALDRQIFARYLQDSIPTLRVYSWKAPSFTYGISQDPADELDLDRCFADRVEVAQRITGGGVLFHDDEMTYSFACSKEDAGEPRNVFVSYKEVCGFLVDFYKSLGLKPCFAVESKSFAGSSRPHRLCAASYEKYDIVINSKKIGGNAQKRKRNIIFQHGSIPLTIDWALMGRYAKAMPDGIASRCTCLCEQLATVPAKEILEEGLINAFGQAFGARFIEEKELLYETTLDK